MCKLNSVFSEYWNDICQETVEFNNDNTDKQRTVSCAAWDHYFNTI